MGGDNNNTNILFQQGFVVLWCLLVTSLNHKTISLRLHSYDSLYCVKLRVDFREKKNTTDIIDDISFYILCK